MKIQGRRVVSAFSTAEMRAMDDHRDVTFAPELPLEPEDDESLRLLVLNERIRLDADSTRSLHALVQVRNANRAAMDDLSGIDTSHIQPAMRPVLRVVG